MPSNPKDLIEDIRKELSSAQGTRIAQDYQNALRLISHVVFTRSSGFILEFIQNAEDAGLGLESSGVFQIWLNRQRLKIVHNARPFVEADVRAICGIQSSKRPERGTLGYLGIGFKSVFKVTNSPEIYSNGYQFKFDRNYWPDPSDALWRVLPIWIDEAPEPIDSDTTTFLVPIRKKAFYESLLQDLNKLGTELYLFLRWLKRIEVEDEESGQHWVLENLGEDTEGITTLQRDSTNQRFKFFRKTVEVPESIQEDELTQEYRTRVKEREIAIAFALDNDGNLSPSEAGAMYGGVYSFLPLGEASSGAKFPIQADFLVQPGRDSINYEAKWNHWLVEEVEKLCRTAIEVFKSHDKWKYQYLPAFATEFSKSEAYEQLFKPKLFEPLKAFLEADACIPTKAGGWVKPSEAVLLTEDNDASENLIAMGILGEHEVATALGGEDSLQLAHPDSKEGGMQVKKVGRADLLRNSEYLQTKCKSTVASEWFRRLYIWLNKHPTYTPYRAGRRTGMQPVRYHDAQIILTATGELRTGGQVFLMDLSAPDPLIHDLAQELAQTRPMLHPDILAASLQDSERSELKGFLTGYTGVQVLDVKKVSLDALLPKILTKAQKPTPEDLIKYTRYCQQVLHGELPENLEFWVLAKDDRIRPAKETLLPTEYGPTPNWEPNQKYVGGLNFVSPKYIHDHSPAQLAMWRDFFRKGGVKETPDAGVEEFAVLYVIDRLNPACKTVTRVEKRKVGYDIEAETNAGKIMRIEVKGQSSETAVELAGNETLAADAHKDGLYLFVVCPIPESPDIFVVQDPAAVGNKDKLTIPVSIWKPRKLIGSLP